MSSPSYVRQHELSSASAVPTNLVRGVVNDVTDALGLPRPDEVVPMPAEFAHTVGVPTVEEAIPTPKEALERLFSGGGPLPRLPVPRGVF